MYKRVLIPLSILFFAVALILTGLGGSADMLGKKEIILSKKHAWNDGQMMMLAALFLLGLSFV